MMKKNLITIGVIIIILGAAILGYGYYSQLDPTKPWWKGSKLVVIYVENDPSDSFEVYAESNGDRVLNATVYQKGDFNSSECNKDSKGRYCIVTGADGTKYRIIPHPTGKIDSE